MPTSAAVMTLLQRKVPLTLLLDLVDAERMPSRAILRREPSDLSWIRTSMAAAAASR